VSEREGDEDVEGLVWEDVVLVFLGGVGVLEEEAGDVEEELGGRSKSRMVRVDEVRGGRGRRR
jgi:hypothetical protein